MKKGLVLAVLAAVTIAAWADYEKRPAFELRCAGKHFARSTAVFAEFAPKNIRYDLPEGKGEYVFVFGFPKDERAKFVRATFADGKIVKGELFVWGFDPAPITDEAFRALREKTATVSIKLPVEDYRPTVCFHTPVKAKFVHDFKHEVRSPLGISDYVGYAGTTRACARRVGVNMSKLAYRLTYRNEKDDNEFELGLYPDSQSIGQDELIKKLRAAIEKRHPEKKGIVSDRDVVDYRHDCVVTVTPISAEEAAKIKRAAEEAKAAAEE